MIVAASRAAGRAPLRLALAAMGTRFELALHADDPVHARAAGEEAVAEIEACHHRFNRFAESSLVSLIRRAPAGRTIPLDTDTFELFADAFAVHRASGGAFDIAVAPLVDSLVYANRDAGSDRSAPGMDAIELDPVARTIRVAARRSLARPRRHRQGPRARPGRARAARERDRCGAAPRRHQQRDRDRPPARRGFVADRDRARLRGRSRLRCATPRCPCPRRAVTRPATPRLRATSWIRAPARSRRDAAPSS